MKVIASSLRKGNIVEIDDKLYAILSAENIHPGKGTPVTQVDRWNGPMWRSASTSISTKTATDSIL
jgi:Elongation factor P (EF-P) KOW-like domain